MGSEGLNMLVGPMMAMLAGGLLGSFGFNWLLRRRLSHFVQRWKWWGVVVYYLVIAGVLVGGAYKTFVLITGGPDADPTLQSPGFFFAFGLVVGLPFTLPTLTSVWRAPRLEQVSKKRKQSATAADRLKFAKDLERQLLEIAGDSRDVTLHLRGEKKDVLVFQGDFSRQEGEKLVAALRADMEAVNLQRVEGEGTKGKWWAPVKARQ